MGPRERRRLSNELTPALAHEAGLDSSVRRRQGSFYTPIDVARALTNRTILRVGRVLDPSCGGGAFLLAAAERLEALGAGSRSLIATSLIHGVDTDAGAVEAARQVLGDWAGIAPSDVENVSVRSAFDLVDRFDAIVGNPPFLGQLKRDTARGRDEATLLAERFAVGPYTDTGALFLPLAMELLARGGRATLVQPQSLLSARDAGPVRDAIDGRVVELWIDRTGVFGAHTPVCAVTLTPESSRAVTVTVDREVEPLAEQPPAPLGALAALAFGVPPVAVPSSAVTIGAVAEVTAGFRQHFYGMADAVGAVGRPLITSGLIHPMRSLWGVKATKFAGTRYEAPRVDRARVDPEIRAWCDARRRPKVLVATQTRVIEALPDEDGDLLPTTPVISVEPADESLVRPIAAALSAPVITAIAAQRAVGAARSSGSIKLSAQQVKAMPLPADRGAWDAAVALADDGDWLAFGRAADRAYGVEDDAVVEFWWERHPDRKR